MKFETIAQRLKHLIDSSNYSRIDIASMAGISKQTLYKYENGIITNIPSDKIENLAEVLGTSPAYIMGWNVDKINSVSSEHSESLDDISSVDNAITDQEASLKIERQKQWESIMGDVIFTEEELQQIIDYAKYIVSKRKDG